LVQYPRQVVLKCANPANGIARDISFLSISDLVSWCEKETEPMHRSLEREIRVEKQIRDTEQWLNEKPSDRLKEMAKAWLDRSDPVAKELINNANSTDHARKQATLDQIQAANQKVFMRECARTGIDPARGVSPSLLRLLGEQNARYDD